jgi:hypothetical protein
MNGGGTLRDEHTMTERLVCHFSKATKLAGLIFASTFFFLLWQVWAEWNKPARQIENILVYGALSVLFGGLAYWGIRQFVARQPYLIIDSSGVHLPTLGIRLLPWEQIREIRQRSDLFGNSYLDLVVPSSNDSRLHRRLRDGILSIVITRLDVPSEQIRQTIQRFYGLKTHC